MSRPPKKPALALDTQLVSDNAPLQVLPKLFIGSIHSSFNLDALEDNGITHILNCSRLPSTFPKNFTYLNIDIRDKDDSNILSCIPISNIFIKAGLNGGGVLVHCIGGRSRSAAFIAAYLMSTTGFGYDDALALIVSARPVASINRGFEIQLRAYSKNNFNVYIAQQVLVRSRIRALLNLRGSKSTIDSIMANIDANNQKTAVRNQRKISDSEMIVITSKSISKPISRPTFSPIPTDQKSLDEESGLGSGHKRSWLDVNESESFPSRIKTERRPENDTMVTPFVLSSKSIKNFASPEPPGESNTSINDQREHSTFSSENKSFRKNLSNIVTDRQSPYEPTMKDKSNTFLDMTGSRKSSVSSPVSAHFPSPLKTPDPLSQSQSFLPKILSRSPSTTCNENGLSTKNAKVASRKGSLDQCSLSPIPLLGNNVRSKSLVVNPTIPAGPPLEIRASSNLLQQMQCSNNNDYENDRISQSLTSMKKSSPFSMDTNEISDAPKLSRVHSSFLPIEVFPPTNSILDENFRRDRTSSKSFDSKNTQVDKLNYKNLNLNLLDNMSNGIDSMSHSMGPGLESETPTKINSSGSRRGSGKEPGGYQAIIREYIPLFDSKTPNIRFSRPGLSSVRIIPPLRGLDRSYCCAWCNVNLFTLANVVRPDIDAAERAKADGFNVLPSKVDISRVHIPTSTTNKTTGLFMRKMSTDLTAAMINSHMSQLQQVPITPSGAAIIHSNFSQQNDDQPFVSNFHRESSINTINGDEERDDFNPLASSGQGRKSSTQRGGHLNFPTTSRARTIKAFNFDSTESSTSSETTTESTSDKEAPNRGEMNEQTKMQTNIGFPSTHEESSNGTMLNELMLLSTVTHTNDTPTSNQSTSSSRSQSPFTMPSTTKNATYDESPRVSIPSVYAGLSTLERPPSIEKSRWLERLNLLRGSSDENALAAMVEADEEAQRMASSHEKYIFLEYLEWMGVECFKLGKDVGEISCYNCKKTIGSWTWSPSDRQSLGGKLECPIFRIHRSTVHYSELHMDVTPMTTPRAEEVTSEG